MFRIRNSAMGTANKRKTGERLRSAARGACSRMAHRRTPRRERRPSRRSSGARLRLGYRCGSSALSMAALVASTTGPAS